MRNIVSRFAGTLAIVYLLSMMTDTVVIDKSLALLWFGIILFGIGLILRPLFLAIGLPISLITLGIFVVVINAWIIMIADWMTPGIQIGGFINAFIVALGAMIIEELSREREPEFEARKA